MTSRRLPEGGSWIDRSKPITFRFDGVEYEGFEGDTLASALLANGVDGGFRSPILGRPRGIMTAGPEEPNAFVEVGEPWFDPIVAATMVELVDGLVAEPRAGVGRLPASASSSRARPSTGTSTSRRWWSAAARRARAAAEAAEPRRPRAARGRASPGRRPTGRRHRPDRGRPRSASTTTATWWPTSDRSRWVASGTSGPDASCSATGATERPIAFAGNDRPGVMLASAAAAYVERFGVLVDDRVSVLTTNGGGRESLDVLETAGAESQVTDLQESSAASGSRGRCAARRRRLDAEPHALAGDRRLGPLRRRTGVLPSGRGAGVARWSSAAPPARTSPLGLRVVPRRRSVLLVRRPAAGPDRRRHRGGARGRPHVRRAREARDVHRHRDRPGTDERRPHRGDREPAARRRSRRPRTDERPASDRAGLLRDDRGAGSRRPARSDPPDARSTRGTRSAAPSSRTWASGSGPATSPVTARTWTRRSRANASPSVPTAGVLDASTLGKIEVVGPDAAAFLDRMYTNRMSTLAVGSIRYGFLLGLDGMVADDGVAMRVAEDRYLVTTTTGNAAMVLDRFEEWLQTEWPELRVYCTSVTEQWARRRDRRALARATSSRRSGPTSTSPPTRSRS